MKHIQASYSSEDKQKLRVQISYISLLVLLILLVFWNINAGSVPLSLSEILGILLGNEENEVACHIVWDIRLPRLLSAMLLGGILSVSGFLLQTFFANPIAGPFVLGISSGAKMVVALVMIIFLSGALIPFFSKSYRSENLSLRAETSKILQNSKTLRQIFQFLVSVIHRAKPLNGTEYSPAGLQAFHCLCKF